MRTDASLAKFSFLEAVMRKSKCGFTSVGL